MPPETWESAKDILMQLAEAPPSGHQAILNSIADPVLRSEISRLHLVQVSMPASFLAACPEQVGSLQSAGAATLLNPGDLLSNRFRIVRLIARGGMGDVYEAKDEGTFGSPLAIKALQDTTPDAHDRLRAEVALARQITHPHVCRIHDIEEDSHRGIRYLTMQYAEGSTLASLLRDLGPLPEQRTHHLALQLFSGLSAAHHLQIIHRDLKPANIILTGEQLDHLLILDFGIAKSLRSGATLTPAGQQFGTPGYMAPEQHQGRPCLQSDIYAAGVVLWECLTGTLPSPYAVPTTSVPRSRSWRNFLNRCLQPDPSQRFASAAEALSALQPLSSDPSRRGTIAIGAGILSAMSLFLAFPRVQKQQRSQRKGTLSLVLVDIANLTGDPQLDGITAALRSQLDQSRNLDVLPESRIGELRQRMRVAPTSPLTPESTRELALRGGAAFALHGTLSSSNTGYALSLTLEQLGPGPRTVDRQWTSTHLSNTQDLIHAAVRRAGNWVRRTCGEADNIIAEQDHAPEDLTTPSWNALQLYLKAVRTRQTDPAAAILFANEAIRIDPEFASALWLRADLLILTQQYSAGHEAWRLAVDAARKRGITNRERLRIESVFYDDAGDYPNTEAAYRSWIAHYPEDYEPRMRLGHLCFRQSRYSEAISHHQAALALSDRFTIFPHFASCLIAEKRFAEALAQAARLRAMGEREWALQVEGRTLFAKHKDSAALECFQQLATVPQSAQSYFVLLLAHAWADLGDFPKALQIILEAAAQDRVAGQKPAAAAKLALAAYLSVRLGDRPRAIGLLSEAIETGSNPRVICQCAAIAARAADTQRAKQLLSSLSTFPKNQDTERRAILARCEILLAENHPHAVNPLLDQLPRGVLVPADMDLRSRAAIAQNQHHLAKQLCARLAGSRALVWSDPLSTWPGLYRDLAAFAA